MGIVRNLTAGEIVGQVLALQRELGPPRGDLLFLGFMGMGEPLHNLDHVHRAIRVLCHPEGAGLSARRITVSTAGLVPGIERLARLVHDLRTPLTRLRLALAMLPRDEAWQSDVTEMTEDV